MAYCFGLLGFSSSFAFKIHDMSQDPYLMEQTSEELTKSLGWLWEILRMASQPNTRSFECPCKGSLRTMSGPLGGKFNE